MALRDYSHAFAIGWNCTPVNQLQLAAQRQGISEDRIKGPFDWLMAPLNSVVLAINSDFRGLFESENSRIVGALPEYWRVYNDLGFLSMHHFRREEGSSDISREAWNRFGHFLHQRVAVFKSALSDPSGNVLIVRLEDAGVPDDPKAVAEMAEVISDRSLASITIAAVAFGAHRTQEHDLVRAFCVEQSWPRDLPLEFVDWGFDYGFGPAWEGHAESWARMWEEV